MTAGELISSGLLESFCLGFTSQEEDITIREMAAGFPEVEAEINKIRDSLSNFLLENKMEPSASVKTKVMHTVYAQQAEEHPEFVPLMHKPSNFERYFQAVIANHLGEVNEPFENLFVTELPSTNEVINFAVWAKQGHEEETHFDRNEFIAILDGSCDMFMDGKRKSYVKGDIISIEAGVPHYAVITSERPMFAFVQRQLI